MESKTAVLTILLYLSIQAYGYKEVRLMGGTSPFEGRVEINHNGEWGTVCSTGWDLDDARVVCSQLGYELATVADTRLEFGPGNGTIWLDNVDCNGNENSLDQCDARWSDTDPDVCDSHYKDAGVICSKFAEGGIRLYGGDNRFEGQVEMYYKGRWGTICDHNWSGNDAIVACRQLGYPKARYALNNAWTFFGFSRYEYIVEDLGCDGYESKLIDCRPIDFSPEYCDAYDIAGLVCYETPPDTSGLPASAIAGIVVASIFVSMFMLCCCAAACSSTNRKRHTTRTRTHRRSNNQGEINTVYSPDRDAVDFGRYPSPPSLSDSGAHRDPFTPPAGYVPGYVPPLPLDKPPAYESLDINPVNTTSTSASSSSPPVAQSTTVGTISGNQAPAQLPSVETPPPVLPTEPSPDYEEIDNRN